MGRPWIHLEQEIIDQMYKDSKRLRQRADKLWVDAEVRQRDLNERLARATTEELNEKPILH